MFTCADKELVLLKTWVRVATSQPFLPPPPRTGDNFPMPPDGVVLDIRVAAFVSAVDSLLTVGGSNSPTFLYPRSRLVSFCFGMGQAAIAMDTEGRVSSLTAAFVRLFPLVFLPLRRRSFESLFFVL